MTAEAELRVIAVPADKLRHLCRKYPLLQQRMEESLARHGREPRSSNGNNRLSDLQAENARLRNALLDLAPEPCQWYSD